MICVYAVLVLQSVNARRVSDGLSSIETREIDYFV